MDVSAIYSSHARAPRITGALCVILFALSRCRDILMGAPALLLKKRACASTSPIKTGTDLVGVRFCSTFYIIAYLRPSVKKEGRY